MGVLPGDAAPARSLYSCAARSLALALPNGRLRPYPAGPLLRCKHELRRRLIGRSGRTSGQPLLASSQFFAKLKEEAMIPSLRQVLRTRAASTLSP